MNGAMLCVQRCARTKVVAVSETPPIEPILVDARTAAASLSLSEPYVYNLIRSGELRSVRIGRRVLIPVAALHQFVADRESAA